VLFNLGLESHVIQQLLEHLFGLCRHRRGRIR